MVMLKQTVYYTVTSVFYKVKSKLKVGITTIIRIGNCVVFRMMRHEIGGAKQFFTTLVIRRKLS